MYGLWTEVRGTAGVQQHVLMMSACGGSMWCSLCCIPCHLCLHSNAMLRVSTSRKEALQWYAVNSGPGGLGKVSQGCVACAAAHKLGAPE